MEAEKAQLECDLRSAILRFGRKSQKAGGPSKHPFRVRKEGEKRLYKDLSLA
jgi:hypothetical protein